jgi:hypothetical protein
VGSSILWRAGYVGVLVGVEECGVGNDEIGRCVRLEGWEMR